MSVRFQVNGRDIDANDVRVIVELEDDAELVVLLGADGMEQYTVDATGGVVELGGSAYADLT